jgi:Zn-dependent protease
MLLRMSKSEYSAVAQTPILDSGTLPLRTPEESTVVGIIGGALLALIPAIGLIHDRGSSNIGILPYVVALSVAILIHELGHLTAGWCVGFRFHCIAVGPFALYLKHGGLKLSLVRVSTALGYASMHVGTVVRLRRRLLLFVAAGPVANLVTVPFAVLSSNHTFFSATHRSSLSFAAQLTMISILLSVLNLLPLPVGPGLFTDGFRVATLLRDRERTRRLLSICAIGAQRQKGKLPKKWKQTWLKAASSVRDDSVDDFQGNWLAYISCIARNEGGSGAVHLERCLQMTGSLTDTVRDLTAQEAAIFSARFRRDAPLAEKWLKQIVRPKLRNVHSAQPPRKVQFPPSARRVHMWSEST